ncbi:NAD+ synthase [Piscinibacter sp. Jin2]|uniref:Glutamine-dependent NAD(+) synthetase n=1 Tax=Aquariibacter lacus TaxID=2801332 RepID=A0A9X0XEX2_9BURK|nr:NAD+ synthase [Piscinibacter lacus]MBL0720444.1 NAD+ synthase [Piscinibacter lacus]
MSLPSLAFALLQFNPVLGDLAGNARRLEAAARAAHARGATVVLAPELALCGYPPEDLLLRPAFLAACASTVQAMAADLADCPGLSLILGHPQPLDRAGAVRGRSLQRQPAINAAAVLAGGRVQALYAKRELPNYQVFDERRYFVGGRELGLGPVLVEAGGRRLGLLICEDAWFDEPAEAAKAAGAQALLVLNASPYHRGKAAEREARMAERARAVGLPLAYAHGVGGQDEMVFDGASFVLDAAGTVQARAPAFVEGTLHAAFDGPADAPQPRPLAFVPAEAGATLPPEAAAGRATLPGEEAEVWAALVTGVRDYVGKNGFPGAILGLSGGIDSALVLAIAVEALGADRVRAVMMPSPYTADISWLDARDMAERLGVQYDEIAIAPAMARFREALAFDFAGKPEDATEENLQARIRGTLLMALSNKGGRIVLTTGNKSEMATGYCTLYGDMAGGFAVIKDVAKTLVWRLARWRNAEAVARGEVEPIPERIITRPPSAELRPDQCDQDSLPPYEVLDAILARYMEDDASIEQLLAEGYAPADVERVTRLIQLNEYKRRQAPIGIRITHRAFGRDWRYPITSKFRA